MCALLYPTPSRHHNNPYPWFSPPRHSLAPLEKCSDGEDNDDDDDGTPSEELFCVCRKPMDEATDEFWVGCDGGCAGWFHPACVDMSDTQAKSLANSDASYSCATCVARAAAAAAAQEGRRRQARRYD